MARARPKARPLNGACAYELELGHKVRGAASTSGRYRICLTENQKRVLLPPGTKKIGEGSTASVFARPDGMVVKITRDSMDVAALRRTQGMPHVVRATRFFELKSAAYDAKGRPIRAWGIVVEKLKPLSPSMRAVVREVNRYTVGMLLKAFREQAYQGMPAASFRVPAAIRQRAPLLCGSQDGARRKACQAFVPEFVDAWEQLAQRGVVFQDAHEDNIMRDGKTWKAVDLGMSDAKDSRPLPMLEGARRRR